ncbi:hypothetical protein [Krasilnikovia sp. MM14-A1259]|uniref:AraC-like ligand-binding domain-containing protein n=1 Tax=Krasilnikovia sp. MM14-A1259 TaxID=3373539 RepID=UPI0037F5E6B6
MGSAAGDTVPVRRFDLVATDPQLAVALVRDLYADARLRISGDERTFFHRHRSAIAGPLTADTVDSGIDLDADFPSFDHLCFITPLRGRVGFRTGGGYTEIGRGESLAYPVAEPFTVIARNAASQILRLPVAPVAAHAGVDPDRFRFTSRSPVTPALGRHFRATMRFLHQVLGAPDSVLADPVLLAAAIDLIAVTALATYPHTSVEPTERPRVQAAAVRRAVEFIDANPARPLTLADIAAAAGSSIPAIQRGFRRQLDTTALLYLRRARIAHADRALAARRESR